MDSLQIIKSPIAEEFEQFKKFFDSSLHSSNPLLNDVLKYIKQGKGKMMRPILAMLVAKAYGEVTPTVYHGALALELLHSASLIHDDVVDESDERRGQKSVNAIYDNKVSVLVGDFILSTALQHAALTQNPRIVDIISKLGQNLAEGEIIQLSNTMSSTFSEDVYYEVIRKKTAILFSSCAAVGACTVSANEDIIQKVYQFGDLLGIAFQIRDDIFDYFSDSAIGKPTGNDMREGKLTLPALYVLNKTKDPSLIDIAQKIRSMVASDAEISHFIEQIKEKGGIDYAEKVMFEFRDKAVASLPEDIPDSFKESLVAYVNFVVERKK